MKAAEKQPQLACSTIFLQLLVAAMCLYYGYTFLNSECDKAFAQLLIAEGSVMIFSMSLVIIYGKCCQHPGLLCLGNIGGLAYMVINIIGLVWVLQSSETECNKELYDI